MAEVAKELVEARSQGRDEWVAEIHARFTCRMHDLPEFMKTLLQHFNRWFNREHQRIVDCVRFFGPEHWHSMMKSDPGSLPPRGCSLTLLKNFI